MILLQTLREKEEWNKHFEAYIRDLDEKKPVIWGGDLNVAPTAIGKNASSLTRSDHLAECNYLFHRSN